MSVDYLLYDRRDDEYLFLDKYGEWGSVGPDLILFLHSHCGGPRGPLELICDSGPDEDEYYRICGHGTKSKSFKAPDWADKEELDRVEGILRSMIWVTQRRKEALLKKE